MDRVGAAVCAATLLLAAAPGTAHAQSSCEIAHPLVASSGTSGDTFGTSVSISGGRAAVGAPQADDQGSSSGAVELFERSQPGAPWTFVTRLVAGDGALLDVFGYGLDLDGDRLAIGALRHSAPGFVQTGATYLFERQSGGAWLEVAKLEHSTPANYDWFGYSIALDGERLVVGAPYDDDVGNAAGTAFVFERQSDTTWLEVAKLVASSPTPGALFGLTIALDGDTCIIGAPNDNAVGIDSGAAHVFERQSDGTWLETAALRPANTAPGDRFGGAVALRGDTLAIGGTGVDSFVLDTGAVALFERDGSGAWIELPRLTSTVPTVDGQFGRSVALDTDRVVVGAPKHTVDGQRIGAAYVFDRVGPDWKLRTTVVGDEHDAGFGASVDVAGAELVVGSDLANTDGLDSGDARAYFVVSAPNGVLLVDPSAVPGQCNDIWDLALPSLRDALDFAASNSDITEIWLTEGEHVLESSSPLATLPSGLRFRGGFPLGGAPFEERDPKLYPTELRPGSGFVPGITAEYWSNATLTGVPKLTQTEFVIDHFWGTGAPATLPADKWSARWTGYVLPQSTALHTFFTTTDDGVRLWINDVLVIDKWIDQSTTEWGASVALQEGVPAKLRMEYFENGGDARAELRWSSPTLAKAIVPSSNLGTGGVSRLLTLDGAELELDGLELRSARVAPNDPVLSGGSIRLVNGAHLVLRDCAITSNRAESSGGAIRVESGSRLEASGCDFVANSCAGSGGAISVVDPGSHVELANSRFLANSADGAGGGLQVRDGATGRATNCLFVMNRAGTALNPTLDGAAAYVAAGSRLELFHCTIANNAASTLATASGGLAASTNCDLVVRGTILWGNAGGGSFAQGNQIRLANSCLDIDRSLVQNWTASTAGSSCGATLFGSVVSSDPLFADPPGLDFALLLGSPAADAGSALDLPEDALDVDRDGDVIEPIEFDLAARLRRYDDALALDSGTGPAPLPDLGCFERAVPPFVEVLDCAHNPTGSLFVASGTPVLGGVLDVALFDPTATMGPGSLPLLGISAALAVPFAPCSLIADGLGMTGPTAAGALLVDFAPGSGFFLVVGAPLAQGTDVAHFPLALPTSPSFVGVNVYLQGVLIDFAVSNAGLTNGLRVALGQLGPGRTP